MNNKIIIWRESASNQGEGLLYLYKKNEDGSTRYHCVLQPKHQSNPFITEKEIPQVITDIYKKETIPYQMVYSPYHVLKSIDKREEHQDNPLWKSANSIVVWRENDACKGLGIAYVYTYNDDRKLEFDEYIRIDRSDYPYPYIYEADAEEQVGSRPEFTPLIKIYRSVLPTCLASLL